MTVKYLNQVGSFECIVQEPEAGWIGEQGEKKTPFVRIPLMVNEGENKGEVTIYKAWLSDGAFDNTIRRLAEVFGFDGDLATLNSGAQTLAGLPCNITTEMENYQGKDRLKVAWLNPPGGGGAKPLEAAKVQSILGKLNAKAKAIAKSVKAAAPVGAPVKVADPAGESDDVPF